MLTLEKLISPSLPLALDAFHAPPLTAMSRFLFPFHPPSKLACVVCFLALATGLHAVTLISPPEVEADEHSATITWRTDVKCGSRVNYSKSPAALNQRADGEVSTVHSVTIGSLEPGTTYHFAVGSSRQQLARGAFTTSGTGSSPPPAAPSAPGPSQPGMLSDLLAKLGIGAPRSAPPTTKAPALRPPPTRATWGNLASLPDHFERHGRDFNATSPDDYAAKAWLFREQARAAAWAMKLDADGTTRIWDGRTRSFGAYNHDGTTKTFFKPRSPAYWQRQPGRSITPEQLPFK